MFYINEATLPWTLFGRRPRPWTLEPQSTPLPPCLSSSSCRLQPTGNAIQVTRTQAADPAQAQEAAAIDAVLLRAVQLMTAVLMPHMQLRQQLLAGADRLSYQAMKSTCGWRLAHGAHACGQPPPTEPLHCADQTCLCPVEALGKAAGEDGLRPRLKAALTAVLDTIEPKARTLC